ncbi:hypothetical protein L0Y65_00910 [Candidatus Micrarchaeota archaeon]|nr:hypothetical protein [Candidatus Micrarchaeota archaeon]
MGLDKRNALILLVFALLSLLMTWGGASSDGYFQYRDEKPVLATAAYREYFFSLMKNSGVPDLDMQKRIPIHIINLIIPDDIFETLKFPVPIFLAFLAAYLAARKVQEDAGVPDGARTIIAAAGALFYVVNPITTQLILSFYPMLVYAAYPLFFLLLYIGFTSHSRKHVFASALAASFMLLMVVHSALYMAVAFAALAPALVLRRKEAFRMAGSLALFAAVLLSCTLFVLLPYLSLYDAGAAPGASSIPTKTDLDMFSGVAELPKPMLLDFSSFWWPYLPYSYPMGGAYYPMAAVLAGALICFAIYERSEWSVMALIALTALIFFAKGSQAPFPGIYEAFEFHLPLGWLMRVPMKFLHIIPFFLFIIMVRASAYLYKANAALAFASIAFALMFLAASSWPLFTGDAAGFLQKSVPSRYSSEVAEMGAHIPGGFPAILSSEPVNYLLLPADISYGRSYVNAELDAYASLMDYDGLAAFSDAGYQYAIVPKPARGASPGQFSEIYSGEFLSLYRLKNDSVPFSVSPSAYICYSGHMALRSLQQDAPNGHSPAVALFPYQSPSFPKSAIGLADHVLIDSNSPLIASTEDGTVFSFPPANGWERPGGSTLDRESIYGYNLKSRYTSSSFDYEMPDEPEARVLDGDDLSFYFKDNMTRRTGALSFSSAPGAQGRSLALARLDLPVSYYYTVNMSISGHADNASAAIVLMDESGKAFSVVKLFEASGAFNSSASRDFFVPEIAAKAILYVSAYASADGFDYNISRFVLAPAVPKGAPAAAAEFFVPESGNYSVFLRIYKGRHAGMLSSRLDDYVPVYTVTRDKSDHISWEEVYRGPLSQGGHTLTILNLGGFNALNVGYVARESADADPFAGKTVIYRLVAKNDFEGPDSLISLNASSSSFAYINVSAPISSIIYVVSPGLYEISSSIEGPASFKVDGREAEQSVYLERGPHILEAIPKKGAALLDHVTLMREGDAGGAYARITSYTRIDPTTYALETESSGPFFLSMAKDINKGWIAEVDGRQYRPVPSFGSASAFLINETGSKRIKVYFEPQGMMLLGAGLGILGLAASAAYAFSTSTGRESHAC